MPKRSAMLARLVRSHTGDGVALVEFALRVMKGEEKEKSVRLVKDEKSGERIEVTVDLPPALEDRMEAMKWLADRGWGRAVETIELHDERPANEQPGVIATDHLEAVAGGPDGFVQ
jgi:hypothetical protein